MAALNLPRWQYVLLSLAILAVLVVAGGVIYGGLKLERTYKIEAAEASDQAADRARVQVGRDCAPLAPMAKNKCEAEVSNAYRSYRKETRDLEAQRTTALWTAYMGGAALLGMAVSIIGVLLVYLTFAETRAGTRVARREYGRARIEALKAAKGSEEALEHARTFARDQLRPLDLLRRLRYSVLSGRRLRRCKTCSPLAHREDLFGEYG